MSFKDFPRTFFVLFSDGDTFYFTVTATKEIQCPRLKNIYESNKNIEMPPKELELFYFIASNPNQVFTREQLLDKIWGYAFDGENRTVDVHIRTLRQKLGDAGDIIETVRGIGYKIGEKK